MEKRDFIQLQNWMRQRGLSTWGIQTGPFAALLAHFVLKDLQLFHFHTGRPISYYPRVRNCIQGVVLDRNIPRNIDLPGIFGIRNQAINLVGSHCP